MMGLFTATALQRLAAGLWVETGPRVPTMVPGDDADRLLATTHEVAVPA